MHTKTQEMALEMDSVLTYNNIQAMAAVTSLILKIGPTSKSDRLTNYPLLLH